MYYNHPLLRAPATHHHDSQHNKKTTIKVTGEGTVRVEPDIALITIGVITEDKILSKAQSENASKTSKVIHELQSHGVAKNDIQTINYNIDMEYDYQDGKQIFRGYRITHLLRVTVRDIGNVGEVVDAAVDSGANQITNIQFTLADPEPFYNEALSIALKNSQQKAKTIAMDLGLKWNRVPVKVHEVTQIHLPPVPYQATLAVKSEATPIQPGELEINAKIDAEFVFYQR